ncbi:hypothetical protein B9T11_10120 [Wohlfahrtiimonas chitiniclastica]|uniref:methyltransferase domain-containing protein n=1 Tax=Wohlfahrtiimonas chitiniclastica TaxID=400946 RepID=UPI000B99B378|nr:methyltransferase domain-containing protein [Wohlfahrtiimonas chitiniclastica]OYQ77505.1 hypothetical protein B9T11_10120 [Wohlfahrtiimonas chitiniclastica]
MITVNTINDISYTDFVGLINQTNVPPGSFSTVTRWRILSNVSKESNVLEIACTTGFSINNLGLESGCMGVGVDISQPSITRAQENSVKLGIADNIKFYCTDATSYETDKKFTHIIVGAGLGFFPQPEIMINQMHKLFGDTGYLLASPFYVTSDIPDEILKKAEKVFGIKPTTGSYKEVMRLYKDFEVYYEDRLKPELETEEEIHHYCDSTINRIVLEEKITDSNVIDAMYKRLYSIKEMSNILREYQGYSVCIFKYNKKNYSKRFVELF